VTEAISSLREVEGTAVFLDVARPTHLRGFSRNCPQLLEQRREGAFLHLHVDRHQEPEERSHPTEVIPEGDNQAELIQSADGTEGECHDHSG